MVFFLHVLVGYLQNTLSHIMNWRNNYQNLEHEKQCLEIQKKQHKKSYDQSPQAVTEGMFKHLDDAASDMMQCISAELNAINIFLAYIALMSVNSKVWISSGIFAFCPAVTAQIYRAHIIGPPLFRSLTRWDAQLPLLNNDTHWMGGV